MAHSIPYLLVKPLHSLFFNIGKTFPPNRSAEIQGHFPGYKYQIIYWPKQNDRQDFVALRQPQCQTCVCVCVNIWNKTCNLLLLICNYLFRRTLCILLSMGKEGNREDTVTDDLWDPIIYLGWSVARRHSAHLEMFDGRHKWVMGVPAGV